jgi:hypothetical protein
MDDVLQNLGLIRLSALLHAAGRKAAHRAEILKGLHHICHCQKGIQASELLAMTRTV